MTYEEQIKFEISSKLDTYGINADIYIIEFYTYSVRILIVSDCFIGIPSMFDRSKKIRNIISETKISTPIYMKLDLFN